MIVQVMLKEKGMMFQVGNFFLKAQVVNKTGGSECPFFPILFILITDVITQ